MWWIICGIPLVCILVLSWFMARMRADIEDEEGTR